MVIGWDARVVQDHFPGIGRYTVALLDALAANAPDTEFVAFYLPDAPRREDGLAPLRRHANLRLVPAPPLLSPWGQVTMRRLIGESGAQLLHSPYYVAPYLTPVPLVVTIHDLIPMAHAGMVPGGLGAWLFPALNRIAAARAHHLITVSEAAAHDIRRLLGVTPDRLTIIPEAPAPIFTPATAATVAAMRARYRLGDAPYLLHVGINKPHKNHARLIHAFAMTRPAAHGALLVLAGPLDPRWPHPQEIASAAGVGAHVRVLGPIPDGDLPPLYSDTHGFIFPSLAEGFGLPMMEAMACGAPCAVSDRTPLTEWSQGTEAALLFDPHSISAIAVAMERLLGEADLRHHLRQRSLARAGEFTWHGAAVRLMALYRRLLADFPQPLS